MLLEDLIKSIYFNLLVEEGEDDPEPDDPLAWDAWNERQQAKGTGYQPKPRERVAVDPEEEPQGQYAQRYVPPTEDPGDGEPEAEPAPKKKARKAKAADVETGDLEGEEGDGESEAGLTPEQRRAMKNPNFEREQAAQAEMQAHAEKNPHVAAPPRPLHHDEFEMGAHAGAHDAAQHGGQWNPNLDPAAHGFEPGSPEGNDAMLGYMHGYRKVHSGTPEAEYTPPKPPVRAPGQRGRMPNSEYPKINGDEFAALKKVHELVSRYEAGDKAAADELVGPKDENGKRTPGQGYLGQVGEMLKHRAGHASNAPQLWSAMSGEGSVAQKSKHQDLGFLPNWQGVPLRAAVSMFGDPEKPGEMPEGDINTLAGNLYGMPALVKRREIADNRKMLGKSLSAGEKDTDVSTGGKLAQGRSHRKPLDVDAGDVASGDEAGEEPASGEGGDEDATPKSIADFHEMLSKDPAIQKAAREAISLGKHPETGEEMPGHFVNVLKQGLKPHKVPDYVVQTGEDGKPMLDKEGNPVPALGPDGKPQVKLDAKGRPMTKVSHFEYKHPVSGTPETIHAGFKNGNPEVTRELIKQAFFRPGPNGELEFHPDPKRVKPADIVKAVPALAEMNKSKGAQHNAINYSKKAFLTFLAAHPDVAENDPAFNELLRLSDVNKSRTLGRHRQRLGIARDAQDARAADVKMPETAPEVQGAAKATSAPQPMPEAPKASEKAPAPSPGASAAPVPAPKAVAQPTKPAEKLPKAAEGPKLDTTSAKEAQELKDYFNVYETPEEAHPDPNHRRHKEWHAKHAQATALEGRAKKQGIDLRIPRGMPEASPDLTAHGVPADLPAPTAPPAPTTESNSLARRLLGPSLVDVHQFIGRIETILRKDA